MHRQERGVSSVEGSALMIVLASLLLLSAIGLGLVLQAMAETLSSGNGRRAGGVMYAAEAGIERVLPDLFAAPDWDAALDGSLRSRFTDGPPSGSRRLADGRSISLDEIVNRANCGRPAACSTAAMDAVTESRPWGPNNPRWRLFGHAPLASLMADAALPPDEYVVVLVADDPAENDANPLRDGRGSPNPGAGLLTVRAEAFGGDRAHRVIEATIARGTPGTQAGGYAAQRGQGSTAEGSAGAAIQVPGGSIARTEFALGGARQP